MKFSRQHSDQNGSPSSPPSVGKKSTRAPHSGTNLNSGPRLVPRRRLDARTSATTVGEHCRPLFSSQTWNYPWARWACSDTVLPTIGRRYWGGAHHLFFGNTKRLSLIGGAFRNRLAPPQLFNQKTIRRPACTAQEKYKHTYSVIDIRGQP
jgi:hypothetical protein